MSINRELMFSSKTDLWETPQDLFAKLDAIYHFDLDACAIQENAKCARYFTPEQDGLAQKWTGRVWCNPPYGRQIGKWVRKAAEANAEVVVMLLPARTDTAWFHEYCLRGGYMCLSSVGASNSAAAKTAPRSHQWSLCLARGEAV